MLDVALFLSGILLGAVLVLIIAVLRGGKSRWEQKQKQVDI